MAAAPNMPYVDKRTGNIVIRVVYDGAPEAGKTTNLIALTERMPVKRRSRLVSPGTTSRRTEYFDWLTFQGGFVGGHRLLCQLVSVPGQPSLLRRRRYLIDSADAVVFVADSHPEQVCNTRYAFSLMQQTVKRRGGDVPASVLVQANKQDLPLSLGPEELGAAMGIAEEVMVIGAEALSGVGVMETFVQAVREGTRRVKRLLISGALLEEDGSQEVSAQELLEALERVEEELDEQELDLAIAPRRREARGIVPRPSAYVLNDDVPEEAPEPAATVLTTVPVTVPPLVPLATGAGHVWPLAMGRRVFAEVAKGSAARSSRGRPWAPPSSEEVEITQHEELRWVLHTSDAWTFEDASAGRVELLGLVKRVNGLGPWRAPGRALSLQVEGQGARLWMATAVVPTLREALHQASEAAGATKGLIPLIRALQGALNLTERHLPDLRLPCAHLDSIGVSYERAVVLAIPEPAEGPPPPSAREELFHLLRALDGLGMPAQQRAEALACIEGAELLEELDRWMAR